MKYRNDLKKRILAGLLAGAALCLAAPAAQAANVVPNTQLPQLPNGVSEDAPFFAGTGNITRPGDAQMNVNQTSQNGVIKWDGFNIGANATVNFKGPENFNTLNYDISGSLSQIYGTINAQGGNLYIVNPNGVEIGNSAQINTGSLYVSNKRMTDETLADFQKNAGLDAIYIPQGTTTDAALMSLGNINANTVTFEGSRIVIDTERIKDVDGDKKLTADNIIVHTNDANNVVIGYDAYNTGENKGTYEEKQVAASLLATIDANGTTVNDLNAYMWVEDVEQLQAIGASADTLKGNYALRNSIDATATQDWTGTFNPLGGTGQNGDDNPFTGKFDGLDYNIFNLNINRGIEDNVGLFGVVGSGAVINNVTLVGGSITGKNNVGALAGSVQGGAHISNVTNSASVTGASNVGGIVGASIGTDENHTVYDGLINTGTIISSGTDDGKGGTVSNAGGLIGYLEEGELGGASYNLGAVKGQTDESGNMTVGYNVGGLVGHAVDSVIGNKDTIDEDGNVIAEGATVYNRLNVTGKYNVGGIVGNMEGSTVQNAENSGSVLAINHKEEVYSYHTGDNTYDTMGGSADDGIGEVEVYIANVGGIAGSSSALGEQESTISNVLNLGDVSSSRQEGNEYYDAGNVGGVVGRAENTNIENATNRENEIRGAHNVGGIAGYFGGSGTVTNGINDGGDIMATGARAAAGGTHNNAATTPADDNVFYGYNVSDTGYALEHVRNGNTGRETVVVGNIGGIVGYMDGDEVYIASSANRGTVHSQEFTGTVPDSSKAANAGGIVGKIDRSSTKNISELEEKYVNAAVSNSYNTGDVRGYTGVGGIAGMMYNGEIAGSYNLGTVNTTRQPASSNATAYETVNMGGIVGDTTEGTKASALLYDVYNKGQIGDETFNYYARHVGGIVGRLSGTVEKAYNTGSIYNGYNVVGGIAGWFAKGTINNSFNTGNITVANKENTAAGVQAGGIAGGASTGQTSISNVYNLGTIRGFQTNGYKGGAVGGIVGAFIGGGEARISNAYTTGNLYLNIGGSGAEFRGGNSSTVGLGSIYGSNGNYTQTVNTENTYYIRPDDGLPFTDLSANNRDNSNKAIDFDKKDDIGQYEYEGGRLFQEGTEKGNVNEGDAWRIYDGSTPILNAFLPNAKDYFDKEETDKTGIGSIQYGTAYDPLLTIINANKDLSFNWQDLGINNDAGLAVYGAGLTLNGFMSTGGSGYFGGLIYSDGALNINADKAKNPDITGNVALGSSSQLYGSSVTIDADGQVTIYGSVTATGNGTAADDDPDTSGSISITGGSVDVYGQLTSAEAEKDVFVPGINGMAADWTPGDVHDPYEVMSDIGDRFGYTTGASAVTGNISITANDAEDGHVNVYYGNKGEGIVTTGGNLTVTASGDIYMDSDLSIGGNLTLNAGQITNPDGTTSTAEGSEAVLDISNIGKVQAANDDDASHTSNYYLNEFLTHFADEKYNITLGGDKTKLAVDMWGDGAFDLTKYDYDRHTLAERINELNLEVNGKEAKGQDYTYIWVSTGEQLAGIQQYYEQETAAGGETNILSYNFALKNDIDASNVRDYKAIGAGTTDGYTGTFDGRDNRIIGLTMTGTNAGIFDTIGTRTDNDGKIHTGTVEDLRIYSGTFSGANNAGAIAGVNEGNISNVTAFGNVVDVNNQTGNDSSYAGGIAGTNSGSIDNASAIGTATQSSKDIAGSAEAAAGGIAGLNSGTISNSSANSAVNASAGNATALGGVAGVNTDTGTLNNVDSLGVTTGGYKVQGQNTLYSDNVGGIAGTNSGTVKNVYNESIVSGRDNVGGIFGENSGTSVSNVANAADVTGEAGDNDTSDYVGGLAGSNSGSITGGRNNGEITGNNYVGGLVGANRVGADGKKPELTNLVNDSAAAITGDNYVGGIAGSNAGTISADEDNDNLINRGTITGQMYVGGVAGENTGTIANTHNDVELHVRYDVTETTPAKYFGGVAGINGHRNEDGTIIDPGTITSATNTNDIIAPEADYVGGIVGWNPEGATLNGMGNSNEGRVEGASHVGGVAGLNEADIKGTVDAMIGIENSGVVIAHNGGAGGIFGENKGAIEYVEMTNNGIVSGSAVKDGEGTDGTGGIFGVNSGDVTYSSLKNEIGGQVMGTQNVGGLIGVNTGNITGGRTEADNTDVGYYKYQIYNNGTIKAGTWDDADQDGVVDEGEFTEATTNSQNIAGLFGVNQKRDNGTGGEVTAGYNTGAIIAGDSTNVGGIAGTNAGTLDQVFNTVIAADGQNQTITGSTSVGGIAGTNTGSISNAYNTSIVTGTAADAVSGSIAGTNSNTADDSISNVYSTVGDNLVGSGNAATHVYDSENGFDEENEEGSVIDKDGTVSDAPWRQYGDNNPILKVFLTQLTVNETGNDKADGKTLDEYLNLVYNGKEQDINIQDLIDKGFITGPDGMIKKDEDGNSVSAVSDAHKNTMKNDGTPDSALLYNTGNKKDAGDYYNWIASAQIAAGNDGNPNNLGYDIDFKDNEITIGKATIKVTLEDIYRIYGNSQMYTDKDHTKTANGYDSFWSLGTTTEVAGAADDLKNVSITVTSSSDGAVNNLAPGKTTTNNVGDYNWGVTVDISNISQNYQLEGAGNTATSHSFTGEGKSHVGKADLNITAGSDTIYVGGTPHFSGTVDHFVNGDSFHIDFGLSADNADLPQIADTHNGVVGFWYDNRFYTSGTQGLQDLFGGNYNVTFKPGTLTVLALPDGMPDIPEIPGIENHWNGLLGDNPWDRNRDFRERKAEIHYIAGGMTL